MVPVLSVRVPRELLSFRLFVDKPLFSPPQISQSAELVLQDFIAKPDVWHDAEVADVEHIGEQAGCEYEIVKQANLGVFYMALLEEHIAVDKEQQAELVEHVQLILVRLNPRFGMVNKNHVEEGQESVDCDLQASQISQVNKDYCEKKSPQGENYVEKYLLVRVRLQVLVDYAEFLLEFRLI